MATRSKAKPHNPPISKLEDNLLVEILIRLPDARSAVRCKSVCKQWTSLISDPNFRRRFVSHHRNEGPDNDGSEPPLLAVRKPQSILSFLPLPDAIRKYLVILDSCKDLVLCGFQYVKKDQRFRLVKKEDESYPELGRLLIVCNPFTKQWVALPLAPERSADMGMTNLACEPRSNSHDNNGQALIDSEYRFRVVHVYGSSEYLNVDPTANLKVDLFCSESREWMTGVIDMGGHSRLSFSVYAMSWCNGKLYCPTFDKAHLAAWNPFHPDIPPTFVDAIPVSPLRIDTAQVWASQGALHTVCHFPYSRPGLPYNSLSVWRWGEDQDGGGEKWMMLYGVSLEVLLRSGYQEYGDLDMCDVLGLHPSKPEVVFLEFESPLEHKHLMFACNLKSVEMKLFARGKPESFRNVVQPRFTCWPTPIPSYEKLRGLYNGNYRSLVQSSSKSSTPLITEEECQAIEGVEQIGQPRKSNGSTSQPKRPVKKQKVVRCCCRKQDAIKRKISKDQLVDFVHALQDTPDIDDELFLDACDLFEDEHGKTQMFLALDGGMRKKWLARKFGRKESA